MKLYLVFPLLSSLLFVAAMLTIKRATAFRIGVWRTTFIANLATAILFLALLPLGGAPIELTKFWQPLIIAALFIGGQACTFWALEKGDVSVATPTMGIKTLMVGWLSVLFLSVELSWQLWTSAGISFAAVGLLSARSRHGSQADDSTHYSVWKTVAIALLAALCYSAFDITIQKWSPEWGVGRLLPIVFFLSALLSLCFMPFFSAPLSQIGRPAWPWLAGGAFFMAAQALSLVTAIGTWGDATSMNVVYSSRGLWSVAAVWLIGHWFDNQERTLGSRTLKLRLAGAVAMSIAIVIAFVGD